MLARRIHLISLILVVLCSTGNAFAVDDPSLVIYYDFEDFGNNLVVLDKSGKSNDAKVISGVSGLPVAGVRNTEACQVTGNGSYLDLDGANFPAEDIPTTAFTLAYWVKPENTGDTQTIFSALAAPHSWCHGGYIRNNKYHAHIGDINNNYIINAFEGTVEYGAWHHMAFTWELVPGEYGGGAMYIDGNLVAKYGNAFVEAPPGVKAADNWDGGARIGQDVDSSWQFNGLLDDFCIFKRALSQGEIIKLMHGMEYLVAYGPTPADGSILTETWVNLSWYPGERAASHDVYLGDNLGDVEQATRNSAVFRGNQISTSYITGFPGYAYPDGLVPGTTYYWRIDEVNNANPNSPWKGDVWSFSIPPRTAYNPSPADGAEFVALDVKLSWTAGFRAKLHTVYLGDDFDTVAKAAGGLPQGVTTYNPGPLKSEKVYYWRVDEFDGASTYKGNIWAFTTPGAAGSPKPANGAAGVQMTAKLSWTPATNATSHQVYFGTDKEAVKNATTASPEYKGSKAKGSETYDPGKLAWYSPYYWRVDAVYSTGTVKGLVWSFTTADFITVDDFESYNDLDPLNPASNRIFDTWKDGFETPTTNGALASNDMPPYAEQATVHSGAQSMPYRYDNANKTSEATMTLVYPRDWTEEGVAKLSLWFRGAAANAAERMYVALNGGTPAYHADPKAAQAGGWTEWVIDLQAFQGVTLTNVNTISIGFGTKGSPAAGGTGKVYFDDIRLVRP